MKARDLANRLPSWEGDKSRAATVADLDSFKAALANILRGLDDSTYSGEIAYAPGNVLVRAGYGMVRVGQLTLGSTGTCSIGSDATLVIL